jgi:hypothetical protein
VPGPAQRGDSILPRPWLRPRRRRALPHPYQSALARSSVSSMSAPVYSQPTFPSCPPAIRAEPRSRHRIGGAGVRHRRAGGVGRYARAQRQLDRGTLSSQHWWPRSGRSLSVIRRWQFRARRRPGQTPGPPWLRRPHTWSPARWIRPPRNRIHRRASAVSSTAPALSTLKGRLTGPASAERVMCFEPGWRDADGAGGFTLVDKGKPDVSRGRKATGPTRSAGLPRR